jgi:hypothetical protein
MAHTKGSFIDGTTGWKVADCITNGSVGYEIHFNDDGECITDHVYELEDAKLIAAAPDMLKALEYLRGVEAWISDPEIKRTVSKTLNDAIKKAIG